MKREQATETLSRAEKVQPRRPIIGKQNDQPATPDARVRQLKDQLIRAKVYLSLPATRNNPHFTRELRLRVKEVQRAVGDATKDSDLPRKYVASRPALPATIKFFQLFIMDTHMYFCLYWFVCLFPCTNDMLLIKLIIT